MCRYADTWKRRGQARSALSSEHHDAALVDLSKALELMPLMGQVRGKRGGETEGGTRERYS